MQFIHTKILIFQYSWKEWTKSKYECPLTTTTTQAAGLDFSITDLIDSILGWNLNKTSLGCIDWSVQLVKLGKESLKANFKINPTNYLK